MVPDDLALPITFPYSEALLLEIDPTHVGLDMLGRSRFHGNCCSCEAGEREPFFVVGSKVTSAYARNDMELIGDAVQLMDVELKG